MVSNHSFIEFLFFRNSKEKTNINMELFEPLQTMNLLLKLLTWAKRN